ncbi:MAG TPA: efflux transporter outer membrane subunit [Syntrophobacter fumaroxidans]|nr:efflux transporter outer membrane subunit [Syntrophobacter fumaroxidans]
MPSLANRIRSRSVITRFGPLLLPAVCFLLAGCMVGPDFHRPKSDPPGAYTGVTTGATREPSVTTGEPARLIDWWKAFDDPVLTSLIERAVTANLDVRQAHARIRQARATRGVAASGLFPEIDAGASYSYSRGSPGTVSSSGGGTTAAGAAATPRELFQVGFDASWELDFFGGTRRNIEASDADLKAAVEDRRDVLVSIVAEVGTEYVTLRGLQAQLLIARKNLASQKHTADITRKRWQAGFVSALDVANADAQASTTEAQIPILESSIRATIYSLSLLLAQHPAALLDELSADGPIPPIPPEVPVGLPSDLIRRRPDIRRTEAQVHAATARIGVATADLFPKFALTGSMGLMSADLNTLANLSNRFWSLGPTVSWPIFTAGRIQCNIEVQNAVQEQTLLAYDKTILTALKDVETALTAYAKEQEHNRSLAEAVAHNRKAVDLSMRLYLVGKIDFLNVLNAQRSLYLTEEGLALSNRTLTTNLIALYKALGGGWERES